MTNEETIAYFKEHNEILVSVAKDENAYDYEQQVIDADYMRRIFEANEKAIQALEQTRWIPCSERLPEEDGMYLISTCMNCIDTCLFYKDDDGYLWVDYEESVIAWMPLPAPYQPPTMMCEED